jgi:hypothetical protein
MYRNNAVKTSTDDAFCGKFYSSKSFNYNIQFDLKQLCPVITCICIGFKMKRLKENITAEVNSPIEVLRC